MVLALLELLTHEALFDGLEVERSELLRHEIVLRVDFLLARFSGMYLVEVLCQVVLRGARFVADLTRNARVAFVQAVHVFPEM